MADPKIRIRRSATPNKVPSTTQLQLGELAINTYDGKVYLEQDQGGVGVGTTVIAINPWSVGVGSTAYNTHFTAGKVGVGTTNAQYNLDVGGNVNFTGSLYQDGSLFTSGSTGVGLATAGGIVGYAATVIDFRGPGVTTAYYSSATGIGTVYFHSVTSGGGGGGASVTVSDAAPGSPSNGDLWFKSDVGELYVYYTDGSSNQWVEASGGSNTCVTSDTAPTSPQDGDLWWNSNTGELKIYYNDGNSSQWVDANSEGGFVQYWTQTNTNGTLGVTTTSYVGIGTTTATDALTVTGNANVTGFLTATQLNGVVESTGVNVSGVTTALHLKGPVTSSGVNVTGVATALQLKGPLTSSGINVTGVSTFSNTVDINSNLDVSGNATIGGVLTYEDVRNVDSIGIVTARTGLKVLAGGANIVDGTTTDELNVTGVATAVQLNATTVNISGVTTTGHILPAADSTYDLGSTNKYWRNFYVDNLVTAPGGPGFIGPDLTVRNLKATGLSTFVGAIDADGDLDVDGHTELDNVNVVGIATIQQVKATTVNVTGVSTVTGGVKVGTAATICSEGNMTIDRPSAGIITATKFIGDGSDLTGVISGIGIGTAGGVVGYAATIVHFKGAGVTTAYYNAATGIGTVFFHSTAGGGGGGNANVTIADAAPSSPSAGDLWWESDIGELKIYYNDGNSSQWVDASGADSLVQMGTSAPSGAVSGDLWWNSESGDLMVYYTDANSSAWISVNAVNSERIWSTNSTGIHTSRSVGIGTTTVTDPLTVVGATDLDGTLIVSGITTFGSHVYHGDNDRAIFGDGSDLEIYHSGTKSIINDAGTGSLELQVGGSTKLETTAGGAKVWGTVGSANTALVVVGDARVTGIITVGTGSLKITDRDINMVGVITGANFKSGTTNVHNVGVEAAGINVLGADTPIGTGATVYNSGLIVGKKGAEFQGVVTATTFVGAVTGNAATATLATNAQGLTGTPAITVGALTATTGQFSGNVNVLGTLTYEDVKNVDSAGIATARQGLRVTGGGLDVVGVSTFNDNVKLLDNDQLRFGNGNDINILHSGSSNLIRAYNVPFKIQLNNNHESIVCVQAGEVQLYHNNAKKFETTSTGVNITGASSRITGSGQSRLMIGSTNAGGAAIYFDGDSNGDLAGGDYSWILHNTSGDMEYVVDNPAAAGNHIFKTGGSSERLRITSAGELKINHNASGASANSGANEFSIEGGNTDIGMSFISPAANNRTQTIAFGDSSNTIAGRIQYAHGDDSLRFRTGDAERLMLTGGGQLIQYTTHTSGNSAHSNTSWYGDDASQYNIQIRDFNEMYATKLTNANSYQQIIYKREKMTHFCDVEFTLSADSDQAGSGYYHLAMPICGDGSDTMSNFDTLVLRSHGSNSGLNQVRVDKGGGGYGFNVTSSSIPEWFDGAERHIQIKIRGRRYSVYSDGVEITTQYSDADNPRQNGFFGFAIYEASTVNPWLKIRDFKLRNHSLNTALPSYDVIKSVPAASNNSSVFECTDLNNPRTIEMRFWRLRHSGATGRCYMRLGPASGYINSGYYDIGTWRAHNDSGATIVRSFNQGQWTPFTDDFTNSTNYYSGSIIIKRISNPGYNTRFLLESHLVVDYDSGNTQYMINVNGQMTFANNHGLDQLKFYHDSTTINYGDVEFIAQH